MSIRDEARQEAERRWPVDWVLHSNAFIREQESSRRAFRAGAVWVSEQADREPSEDYPDVEGLAALRANREPSERHDSTETGSVAPPSGAEVLAASNAYMGYEPPYEALDDFSPEFLADIRAALLAAQEVRHAD